MESNVAQPTVTPIARLRAARRRLLAAFVLTGSMNFLVSPPLAHATDILVDAPNSSIVAPRGRYFCHAIWSCQS